jgi:hypothetical protein
VVRRYRDTIASNPEKRIQNEHRFRRKELNAGKSEFNPFSLGFAGFGSFFSILRSKYFRFFLSGTMIGILIGAASFNVLVSYRMDEYIQKISRLESVNEEKDLRLRKLEDSMHQPKFILKRIEINLLHDGDELDKITLEKYIMEKYQQLLGKEVGSIDADLAAEVIDKRIMKLGEKEYKLKIDRLTLGEVLKVRVEASLID